MCKFTKSSTLIWIFIFQLSIIPFKNEINAREKNAGWFETSLQEHIQKTLPLVISNKGRLNDMVYLAASGFVGKIYEATGYQPIWCEHAKWLPLGDSLFSFIQHAKEYGLFPGDYHFQVLNTIRQSLQAGSGTANIRLWADAELMMTDAFLLAARHLRQGRLAFDSVTLRTDSVLSDDFYLQVFDRLRLSKDLFATLHQLEPKHPKYNALKEGLKNFLDSVGTFNDTCWEKFKQVAITLDRYKLLPDTMPPTYIWVNIPAFTMQVIEENRVVLESRIIVGRPKTKTPSLTSQVTDFTIYPPWNVPLSISVENMLPVIKSDRSYLLRKNLVVVDVSGRIVEPGNIDWSKLNKRNFPYRLKQRQGSSNALGVVKFNFQNEYSVYLHDTNARGLFNNDNRALSHGCIRVEQFRKLTDFLLRSDTVRYPPGMVNSLIKRKQSQTISGFPVMPLFIRYFSCEGKNGKLQFYEDMYGEDKLLKERYFNKAISQVNYTNRSFSALATASLLEFTCSFS